jgi:hypothetical protein
MSKESLLLVSTTSTESQDSTFVYSSKKQGAAYHNQSDGVHTTIYQVDNFIGVIKLQGTLELYPGDNDWVDIADTVIGIGSDSTAWSTTHSINFTGNFVWIRAAYNLQNGTIVQIRYNH